MKCPLAGLPATSAIISALISSALFAPVSRGAQASQVEQGEWKLPDKSEYTLFHPTPRELMRKFETDRPDRTESPYTVDAGHFQAELDLLAYPRKGQEENIRMLVTNLKLGLTNYMDLQLVIGGVNSARALTPTGPVRRNGLGDTFLRLKFNLQGNDGGPIAIGLMPFVKFPTAGEGLGDKKFEGGVIFPLALELPGDWDLGSMFELDKLRNRLVEGDEGYHSVFITTLTFSHDIIGPLSGYGEFYSETTHEPEAPWVATLDSGIVCELLDNLHLDAGINVGVTDAAEDIVPFIGMSFRF